MTTTPLCKNCQNYRVLLAYGRLPATSWCTRPIRHTFDLVGEHRALLGHLDPYNERATARSLFGRTKCGPSARYFQQSVPTAPPSGESGVRHG